jgi:hypothetical protein
LPPPRFVVAKSIFIAISLAVCFLGFALPVMVVCCYCCCCRSNQDQNKRKTPQDQLLQAFLTLLSSFLLARLRFRNRDLLHTTRRFVTGYGNLLLPMTKTFVAVCRGTEHTATDTNNIPATERLIARKCQRKEWNNRRRKKRDKEYERREKSDSCAAARSRSSATRGDFRVCCESLWITCFP